MQGLSSLTERLLKCTAVMSEKFPVETFKCVVFEIDIRTIVSLSDDCVNAYLASYSNVTYTVQIKSDGGKKERPYYTGKAKESGICKIVRHSFGQKSRALQCLY